MDQNWTASTTFSVLLVASAHEHGDSTARLLELATRLDAAGHQVRVIAASDAATEAFHARAIPCSPVRYGPEHSSTPGELATYASAIFRAFGAKPAHIIHTASLRASYAAALARFAYTVRHPCAPEPAIVTTLDDEDRGALARRLLPGDCFIVSSQQARDALVGGGGRHARERTHILPSGRDVEAAAMLAVYHLAWERRQRENRQALVAFEA
jgi:hypothetical protein